ncbi:MAG: hypothetical protein ACTSXC_06660 [Candidatus Freyarchaeota archaeon]|nr:hypothetical protein [Candidatus Freyrarchaeum guaymaensis]
MSAEAVEKMRLLSGERSRGSREGCERCRIPEENSKWLKDIKLALRNVESSMTQVIRKSLFSAKKINRV